MTVMREIDIETFVADFEALVGEAEAGEVIAVTRQGVGIFRLEPFERADEGQRPAS